MSTHLQRRAAFMAGQLRAEAELHNRLRFGVLSARATLLERGMKQSDPELLTLLLGEATDALVVAITQRTERMLEQGVTP